MKPFNSCMLSLAVLVAGVALPQTGCQTSETGALEPQNTTKFDAELRKNFVLMDPGAQKSVTCMGLKETTLSDGRMQVDAQVRNRENRRLQVQIQCEFKDAQGFTIDSPSWENFFLTENATEAKSFVSLNDKAKRYTVRVREAR
jgi:uncharacterized protein YcfL